MQAYIHTRSARADGTLDSFLTVRADHKDAPLWWQLRGLTYTATGYGKRIPTRHMVRFNGRWRRVYCCIFSNASGLYIGKLSDGLTVTID